MAYYFTMKTKIYVDFQKRKRKLEFYVQKYFVIASILKNMQVQEEDVKPTQKEYLQV